MDNLFLLPAWLIGGAIYAIGQLIAGAVNAIGAWIGGLFEGLLQVLPLVVVVILIIVAAGVIIGTVTFVIVVRGISRFLARRAP